MDPGQANLAHHLGPCSPAPLGPLLTEAQVSVDAGAALILDGRSSAQACRATLASTML